MGKIFDVQVLKMQFQLLDLKKKKTIIILSSLGWEAADKKP